AGTGPTRRGLARLAASNPGFRLIWEHQRRGRPYTDSDDQQDDGAPKASISNSCHGRNPCSASSAIVRACSALPLLRRGLVFIVHPPAALSFRRSLIESLPLLCSPDGATLCHLYFAAGPKSVPSRRPSRSPQSQGPGSSALVQ